MVFFCVIFLVTLSICAMEKEQPTLKIVKSDLIDDIIRATEAQPDVIGRASIELQLYASQCSTQLLKKKIVDLALALKQPESILADSAPELITPDLITQESKLLQPLKDAIRECKNMHEWLNSYVGIRCLSSVINYYERFLTSLLDPTSVRDLYANIATRLVLALNAKLRKYVESDACKIESGMKEQLRIFFAVQLIDLNRSYLSLLNLAKKYQIDCAHLSDKVIVNGLKQLVSCYQNYSDITLNSIKEIRQMILNPKVQLCLETLDCYLISQEVALYILSLNEQGETIQTNTAGNHAVAPLGNVHFKAYNEGMPLDPGMEKAMYLFYANLFPKEQLLAPSCLLALGNVKSVNADNTVSYTQKILQASQTVTGESLSEFLADVEAGKKSFDSLDRANFGAHVASGILTDPSDAKASNFMVESRNGKGFIVGIDNDMALAPAITFVPLGALHFAGVKNILYFTPLMNEQIEQSIVNLLQNISPAHCVLAWLQALADHNERYDCLLRFGLIAPDIYKKLSLPVKLYAHTAGDLYRQLQKMKLFLQDNQKSDHKKLLGEMQELVARYYEEIAKKCDYHWKDAYAAIHKSEEPFEKVLHPAEKLKNGQTIGQALESEKQQDGDERNQTIADALAELQQVSGISAKKVTGRTPLHEAVLAGVDNEEMAIAQLDKLIFDNRYPINAQDNSDDTALDLAIQKKLKKVFVNLINHGGGGKLKIKPALEFYSAAERQRELTAEFAAAFGILKMANPEFGWKLMLQQLLLEHNEDNSKPVLTARDCRLQYLPSAMCQQLWDEKGEFRAVNMHGRRKVGKVINNNSPALHAQLWFKRMPGIAGFEYAVGNLMHRIIGHGAPITDLLRIADEPFLASQGINGQNLQDLFDQQDDIDKNVNPRCLDDLDLKSISEMIIMTMFVNPEDGRPDNFIVEQIELPNGKKAYRLVCVDNDNAFVPPVARDASEARTIKHVKTILFCLDQMNQPIPDEVCDHFIKLNAFQIINEWLHELLEVNKNYYALFKDEEIRTLWKKHQCFIGVPFAQRMIKRLYDKFKRSQDILKQQKEEGKGKKFTHLDLLLALEPALGKRYQKCFSEKTVIKRFLTLDGPLFARSPKGRLTSTSGAPEILQSNDIPIKETVFDSLKKGNKIGPAQGIEELKAIKEEWLERELGHDLVECTRLETEFKKRAFLKSFDFKNVKEMHQRHFFEVEKDTEWQELFLRNAAVTNGFLDQLNIGSLRVLDLTGCQKITGSILPILAKKCAFLESLNVSEIPGIKRFGYEEPKFGVISKLAILCGVGFMGYLIFNNFYKLVNMNYVIHYDNWSKIKKLRPPPLQQRLEPLLFAESDFGKDFGIKHVGESSFFGYVRNAFERGFKSGFTPTVSISSSGLAIDQIYTRFLTKKILSFPNLTDLNVNGCSKLRVIEARFPQLTCLQAQGCPQLSSMQIACPELRMLDIRFNKLLTDKSLDNVIKDCTRLKELKLNGCSNINYQNVRELAPSYPIAIWLKIADDLRDKVIIILKNKPEYTEIMLKNNTINDYGAKAIAHALEFNTTLTHLDISNNGISDIGGQDFEKSLATNSTLRSLNYQGNAFSSNRILTSKIDALLQRNREGKKL